MILFSWLYLLKSENIWICCFLWSISRFFVINDEISLLSGEPVLTISWADTLRFWRTIKCTSGLWTGHIRAPESPCSAYDSCGSTSLSSTNGARILRPWTKSLLCWPGSGPALPFEQIDVPLIYIEELSLAQDGDPLCKTFCKDMNPGKGVHRRSTSEKHVLESLPRPGGPYSCAWIRAANDAATLTPCPPLRSHREHFKASIWLNDAIRDTARMLQSLSYVRQRTRGFGATCLVTKTARSITAALVTRRRHTRSAFQGVQPTQIDVQHTACPNSEDEHLAIRHSWANSPGRTPTGAHPLRTAHRGWCGSASPGLWEAHTINEVVEMVHGQLLERTTNFRLLADRQLPGEAFCEKCALGFRLLHVPWHQEPSTMAKALRGDPIPVANRHLPEEQQARILLRGRPPQRLVVRSPKHAGEVQLLVEARVCYFVSDQQLAGLLTIQQSASANVEEDAPVAASGISLTLGADSGNASFDSERRHRRR